MAIDDQQISFDMFHEEKDLPYQNVCFKVNVIEEKRGANFFFKTYELTIHMIHTD